MNGPGFRREWASTAVWRVAAAVCLLSTAAPVGEACPICPPLPVKTTADWVIDSDDVLFAREDAAQPFTWHVVEVLKGQREVNADGPFLNSSVRSQLKSNSDCVALLVRPGAGQPWRCLGTVNAEHRQIIQRIVAFSAEWQGTDGQAKRLEYFLTLFGHEDRSVFEMAYLELSRAPYAMIKRIGPQVSAQDFRHILSRREYAEWRSAAILMLAQKPDENRDWIARSFADCCQLSLTNNLAAWAAAWIEVNGDDAIHEIETAYLRDSRRSAEEIQAVMQALALHGVHGSPLLRERIRRAYAVAVVHHPQLAKQIQDDVATWNKSLAMNRTESGKPDVINRRIEDQ